MSQAMSQALIHAMNRALGRLVALAAVISGIAAGETALGDAQRLDLYQDGARLVHAIQVPAGVSFIALPDDALTLVAIDGADGWMIERTSATDPVPVLPAELIAVGVDLAALVDRHAAATDLRAVADHIGVELIERLPRAVRADDAAGAPWQDSLDRHLALRARADAETTTLAGDWARLAARAAAIPALDGDAATLLALTTTLPDAPAAAPTTAELERRWRAAHDRVRTGRRLVVERRAAGAVGIVLERVDLRWTPRARLLIAQGRATLVRQATVTAPEGSALPPMPARLATATRTRALAGPAAASRHLVAEPAPIADARSVRSRAEASDWDDAGEAALPTADQSWDVAALAPVAGGEVNVELQSNELAVVSDEWLLAPALSPVALRRVTVRLDDRPLLAGDLDLAVDGTVLGRRAMATIPAGDLIHLGAGVDERIFHVGSTAWKADPADSPSRHREGADHRLRNLGAEPVAFAFYLTQPIAAAKELTVTVDAATTPGFDQPRSGVLRWRLTLAPGEERVIASGWVVEAAPGVRL